MPKSAELKVRIHPATLKDVEALATSLQTSRSDAGRASIQARKREQQRRKALERLKRAAREDQDLLRRGKLRKIPFALK